MTAKTATKKEVFTEDLPQITIDHEKNAEQAHEIEYFIGLTSDAPAQYITVPGVTLHKFVEPTKGRNSAGEPNKVPQRGMQVWLTKAKRDAIYEAILKRGITFMNKDKSESRDFKLKCDLNQQVWITNHTEPLGYYVYFIAVSKLEREKVYDFRSIERNAYKPDTIIKRPPHMSDGWDKSIIPDPKLGKTDEYFTFKVKTQ